jgi:hypothetical protein
MTTQLTEQEMMAARVQALIAGKDIPTEDELMDMLEEEDKEDSKAYKSTAKKTTKSRRKVVEEPKPVQKPKMERKPIFQHLPYTVPVSVVFNNHDIKYKDQYWKIPERKVNFNIELIENPKIAKDVAIKCAPNSTDEQEKVLNGTILYYQIVTYESVPNGWNVLGYVRVSFSKKEGKIVTRTKLFENILKSANCDVDQAKRVITSTVKDNLK